MSILSTRDLHRIFDRIDGDGDGVLSLDELSSLLVATGVHFSLDQLEWAVGKLSFNFEEFSSFYESLSAKNDVGQKQLQGSVDEGQSRVQGNDDEGQSRVQGNDDEGQNRVQRNDDSWDDTVMKDLVEAFQVFDLNGDGYITSEELERVLTRLGLWEQASGRDCGRMIGAYDTNLDGVLDFEEFKNMMLQ